MCIFVLNIIVRKCDEILSVKLRVVAYHDEVSENVKELKIFEDTFLKKLNLQKQVNEIISIDSYFHTLKILYDLYF